VGLNVTQLIFNSLGALPLLVLWVFAMFLLSHIMLRVLGIHLRELLLIVSHSRMVLPPWCWPVSRATKGL